MDGGIQAAFRALFFQVFSGQIEEKEILGIQVVDDEFGQVFLVLFSLRKEFGEVYFGGAVLAEGTHYLGHLNELQESLSILVLLEVIHEVYVGTLNEGHDGTLEELVGVDVNPDDAFKDQFPSPLEFI